MGYKRRCCLVDGDQATPVEIKSGRTMSTSYFDHLNYWRRLANLPQDRGYVVYGGDQTLHTSSGELISWRQLDLIPY